MKHLFMNEEDTCEFCGVSNASVLDRLCSEYCDKYDAEKAILAERSQQLANVSREIRELTRRLKGLEAQSLEIERDIAILEDRARALAK